MTGKELFEKVQAMVGDSYFRLIVDIRHHSKEQIEVLWQVYSEKTRDLYSGASPEAVLAMMRGDFEDHLEGVESLALQKREDAP